MSEISFRREKEIGPRGNELLVAITSLHISNMEGTVNALSD